MTKVYKIEKINISLLDLDTQNPRFLMLYNDSHSQDDIINYLLKNENANEIVKSIIEQDDFRSDSFLYVIQNGERYLVKEGNRRLAAVKALQNPEKYLNNKFDKFTINKIPCLVYSDKVVLDKAVASRHTQIDVKRWSRLAQGAYIYNCIKDGMQLADLNYLKDYKSLYKLFSMYLAADKIGYGEQFKKLVLEWDRATLIERFFSNHSQKYILPYLGYSVDNKSCKISVFDEELFKLALDNFIAWLDPKNVEKITTQMVTDKSIDNYFNEKFYTNKQHSKQLSIEDNNLTHDVEENSNKITSEKEDKIEVESNSQEASIEDGKNISKKQPNPSTVKKHSKDRKTYLPPAFYLSIPVGRARDVFWELRKLSPVKNKMPNSFAIMTRIFLEMTLDFYGEKHISEYKNKNINSKKYELCMKMKDVIDDLKSKNILTMQEYNTLFRFTNNDKARFDNIHTLHQYVHNASCVPNDNDLKTTWDNLSKLFTIIWNTEEVN